MKNLIEVKVLLRKTLENKRFGVSIPQWSQRMAEATSDLTRFYINVGNDSSLRIVTEDVKAVDILEFFT